MQPRAIVITLAAVIAAFAIAFGIGKATSGSEASTGGNGKAAESFDVDGATISANAPKGSLPALKPKPTPTPTPTPVATAVPTVVPDTGSGQGPVTGGGQTGVTGGGQTPITGGGQTSP